MPGPSPRRIMEGTVLPVRDFIKSSIAQALLDVRVDRDDGKVTTEPPVEYFIYDRAIGYKTPAVFVLGDDVDFLLDRGQNYIAAKCKVYVSVLVEDRNADLLTYKCWRYQDALHAILDQAILTDETENIKNIVKVIRAEYSNTFQTKAQVQGPFRKEVMLTLEVEHLEKR